jgi:hypothetical protein
MLVDSKATRKNENAICKTTQAETDDALFNRLMAINVKGTFNPPAHRGEETPHGRKDRELFEQRKDAWLRRLLHLCGNQGCGLVDDQHLSRRD